MYVHRYLYSLEGSHWSSVKLVMCHIANLEWLTFEAIKREVCSQQCLPATLTFDFLTVSSLYVAINGVCIEV